MKRDDPPNETYIQERSVQSFPLRPDIPFANTPLLAGSISILCIVPLSERQAGPLGLDPKYRVQW